MKPNTPPRTPTKKGHRLPLLFSAIFVALLTGFGAIFGTIALVRSARAVYRCGRQSVGSGTYAVLAATAKQNYLIRLRQSGVQAQDLPSFWQSEAAQGKTYGARLAQETDTYVRQVLAGAALFDGASRMSDAEKTRVSQAIQDVLTYQADASTTRFNELAAPMGFTYENFKEAATLLYKAAQAKTALYGDDGAKLQNEVSIANAFAQKKYAHVQLLFIRTEDEFVTDEQGNRVKDQDGNDLLVSLTPQERQQRSQRIETIRSAIRAIEEGASVQMSPLMFRTYLSQWGEGDASRNEGGYYFSAGAKYTKEFASQLPAVVQTAMEMGIATFAEAACSFGVCFLYRTEVATADYAATENADFFSDFYSLLATDCFSDALQLTMKDAAPTGKALPDLIALPPNDRFRIRF